MGVFLREAGTSTIRLGGLSIGREECKIESTGPLQGGGGTVWEKQDLGLYRGRL